MTQAIAQTTQSFKLSPEALEFTNVYLSCLDISETAKELGISREEAAGFLRKKEVKKFIDTVYMEQGYMNRFKLSAVLDKIIESKLAEALETEVYTGKDLLEVLTLAHKIQMDQAKIQKEEAPTRQTNVQVNNNNSFGENLGSLIDRVIQGESTDNASPALVHES